MNTPPFVNPDGSGQMLFAYDPSGWVILGAWFYYGNPAGARFKAYALLGNMLYFTDWTPL